MDAFFNSSNQFLIAHGPNLVGVILPPLIDILNKDTKESEQSKRFLLTLCICFLAACLVKLPYLTAGSVNEILMSFAIIFTESQAVFKLYYKDSYLREKLQSSLEEKPKPPAPEPLG